MLDAVDGAKLLVAKNGSDVAWENADSFLAAGASQWGFMSVHNALNPSGPQHEASLSARCCSAVEFGGYRLDLENNLALFANEASVTIRDMTEGRQLFDDAHGKLAGFTRGGRLLRPLAVPRAWSGRGGLAFSHVSLPPVKERNALHQVLAELLIKPREAGDPRAPDEANLAPTPAVVARGLWRSSSFGSGRVAIDRFVRRLTEFGFEFVPVTAPALTDGKFDAGYQKELPRARAMRIASRIAADVPAARGRFDFVETSGTNCLSEKPGGLNSSINVARLWTVRGRKVWLTWLGCVEGNAAFNSPNLRVYDSAQRQIVDFRTADDFVLKNAGSDAAPSCDYTVDSCLANAELHGDRYVVLTSHEGQAMAVYDLAARKLLSKRFGLSRGSLLSRVLLTPSAKHAVQVNSDGTFFVYRVVDGAQVLLGQVADDEVVVALPDGRFDATAEGAEMVRLRFPGLAGEHALAQFSAKLRVPGLLPAALAGRPLGAAPAVGTPPVLTASIRRDGATEIRLDAKAEGTAPVASIRVFQDGVLSHERAYPDDGTPLAVSVEALPGSRWVSLVAVDAAGLASAPVGRDLGAGSDRRGVHVVAAGVGRYDDPEVPSLPMPASDAEALVAALTGPASGVVPVSPPVLLKDAEAAPEKLKQALASAIHAAGPGETVILFFAGHGVRDEAGRLYLATSGTRLKNMAATALPWDELTPILGAAKGRVVVLLDTCHSGAAGTGFFATNDATAGALLAAMPSNIVILSASKGRELAQETQAGGTFTRAVIDVIAADRAKHDTNRNGVIELSELYRGVKERVRSLTDGQQTPWFARNQMIGDFALF